MIVRTNLERDVLPSQELIRIRWSKSDTSRPRTNQQSKLPQDEALLIRFNAVFFKQHLVEQKLEFFQAVVILLASAGTKIVLLCHALNELAQDGSPNGVQYLRSQVP